MAKRRKHKSTHHRRRHRLGALSLTKPSMLLPLAGVAVGFLAGDGINKAIDKLNTTTTTDATGTAVSTVHLKPGTLTLIEGGAGLGAIFLIRKRGMVGTVAKVAGGVLAGAALRRLLKTQGIITGYRSVPVIGRRMSGYRSVPVIGAVPAQLSGVPSQLQGYNVPAMAGYIPQSGSAIGMPPLRFTESSYGARDR